MVSRLRNPRWDVFGAWLFPGLWMMLESKFCNSNHQTVLQVRSVSITMSPNFPLPIAFILHAYWLLILICSEKHPLRWSLSIAPILSYTQQMTLENMKSHCSLTAFFSSVQFSRSVVSDSVTPWTAARQASLSVTNSQSSLRLTSIESVMPSSHLILCRPLLLPPPIPPSIRVFSNESALCMRWPKYWNFSFSIIPSKAHPGLISFRMDWLDLLAVLSTEFKLSCLLCNHQFRT